MQTEMNTCCRHQNLPPLRPGDNFVGDLFEYASKRKLPQPVFLMKEDQTFKVKLRKEKIGQVI